MNGIHPTAHGSVHVAGQLVDAKDKESLKEIRSKVGIVFQDPDDQLFMPTVGEDIAFGPYNMGIRGAELDAVVDNALAQVGMSEFKNRPPHHLSFGQRRRVAVATVLAMKPEILVLDEPSSNLDPASRRELADICAHSISQWSWSLTICHTHTNSANAQSFSPAASSSPMTATHSILTNESLLKTNRLELPVGFSISQRA